MVKEERVDHWNDPDGMRWGRGHVATVEMMNRLHSPQKKACGSGVKFYLLSPFQKIKQLLTQICLKRPYM